MKPEIFKAYNNKSFLNSHAARPIRVLCELIEPETRLKNLEIENSIVFFGSARPKDPEIAQRELNDFESENADVSPSSGDNNEEWTRLKRIVRLSKYYEEASLLAEKIALWSKGKEGPEKHFICSGGGPGIMEAANRGASNANEKSIALGISLPFEQGVNKYADPDLSFEFHYFLVRKFYFLYHAKAVFVCAGGFRTMDELFETLTLIQTNKLNKKIPIYLYGSEFWNGLINFDQFVKWGVISPKDKNLFVVVDTVEEAYNTMITDLEGSL